MQARQVGQRSGKVGQAAPAGHKRKALDVEALLQWAYGDQRVHEAVAEEARPVVLSGHGRTATAVVTDVLELGCVVDRSAWKPEADAVERVARDALAVDAVVRELPDRWLAGVVTWCAVQGVRPEAYVGLEPRLVPKVREANGRPVMVYADDKCRKPVWCVLEYQPSEVDVAKGRSEYAQWWLALEWLAEYLPGVLQDHEITGFSAPRQPWA